MGTESWTVPELESILDALPARVAWWSPDLSLRYANAALLRLIGRTRSEARGASITELTDARSGEELLPLFQAALAGEPQRFQRDRNDDGELHHSEVRLAPVLIDGESDGILHFSVDADALVRAQQRGRLGKEQLAVLNERQRIAADLEQSVIDRLRGTTQQLAAPGGEHDVVALLDEVIRSVRQAIAELRGVAEASVVTESQLSTEHLQMYDDPRAGMAWEPSGLDVPELLAVLDAVPAAVTAFDLGFYNTFANAASVTAYSFGSREAVHGKQGIELLGPEVYAASLPYGEAAMAGRAQQFVRTVPLPDGGARSMQVDYLAQRIAGEPVGAVALVVDVTSRVEAEAAARVVTEQLALAAERTRIAEDLHDLVIQRLFAAGMLITAQHGDHEENLRQATASIADAMVELEHSVYALHGEADDFDLAEAMQRAVRQAESSWGWAPELVVAGDLATVPVEVAVDVVAVVTEALSNAVRHGQATAVVVRVSVGSEIEVVVTDNGSGLPEVQTRTSGLGNLAARAERRGGRFACRRALPSGTVVEWVVPAS